MHSRDVNADTPGRASRAVMLFCVAVLAYSGSTIADPDKGDRALFIRSIPRDNAWDYSPKAMQSELTQDPPAAFGAWKERDNCEGRISEEVAGARSVAKDREISASVKASYRRLFGSERGKTLVREVFLCSPYLLKFHLGIDMGSASELASSACGQTAVETRGGLAQSMDQALMQFFKTPNGRRVLKDVFACDPVDLQRKTGMTLENAQKVALACESEVLGDCAQSRASPISSVLSTLPNFNLLSAEIKDVDVGARCLTFIRLEKDSADSYTDGILGVTYLSFPKWGNPDSAQLDRALFHEFAVHTDAKGFVNFPDFFIANGRSPKDFIPDAVSASRVIGDPILHQLFAARRAFALEKYFLDSDGKETITSEADLLRLGSDELEARNRSCVASLEKESASYVSMRPDYLSGFHRVVFDGQSSWSSANEDIYGWRGEPVSKRREKVARYTTESLGALSRSSVRIGGKTVPLCLWLSTPALSGLNYRNNSGPRPRIGGD